jgi:hypothetical protein
LLKDAFSFARAFVSEHGFSNEIEWQDSVSLELLTEECFLQEYAWVVLVSGMREAIIRRKFPSISECFYCWSSAKQIADHADTCVRTALQVFRHEPKMRAIAFTASLIAKEGFPMFKQALEAQPLDKLLRLPYIGPITQYHLAKNIGVNIAKPDRHLVRIAQLFGYPSVQDFCAAASSQTGAKAAVVDLVFWRFATLRNDYLEVFGQFASLTEESLSNRPS